MLLFKKKTVICPSSVMVKKTKTVVSCAGAACPSGFSIDPSSTLHDGYDQIEMEFGSVSKASNGTAKCVYNKALSATNYSDNLVILNSAASLDAEDYSPKCTSVNTTGISCDLNPVSVTCPASITETGLYKSIPPSTKCGTFVVDFNHMNYGRSFSAISNFDIYKNPALTWTNDSVHGSVNYLSGLFVSKRY